MRIKSQKPSIVFVIAAYNSEKTVYKAIDSALQQVDIKPYVVVVDHGSSDKTLEVITSRFNSDKRVSIIKLNRFKNEIKSASRPLNTGFKFALESLKINGPFWFLRLDSDDILASNSIITKLLHNNLSAKFITGLLTFYSTSPSQAFLYGTQDSCRSKHRLINGGAYAIAHHSTLIKSNLLEDVIKKDGYLYSKYLSYGEDLDLTLRLLKRIKNSEIKFNNNSIIYKYRGESTLTNRLDKKRIWNNHLIIFKKHKELSKLLLLRMGFDLFLRNNNFFIKKLRRSVGLPAMQVGFEKMVNFSVVQKRLNEFSN